MDRSRIVLVASVFLAACGANGRTGSLSHDGSPGFMEGDDGGTVYTNYDGSTGNGQAGCGELTGCYTVYAHSDHVLYHLDLVKKLLETVGPFHAPMVNGKEDVITDFAVAPDDSLWAISNTNLYNADPHDGHVTLVGPVTTCGSQNVALTFAADGNLYAADYKGAFCRIDTTTHPPTVTQIGTLGGGLAVSGDLVAVADGTMYATAYDLADHSGSGTTINNVLVKIDPKSGAATQTLGATGFPKLFGVAYFSASGMSGQVFGFTHDGTGHVVTIDPKTGAGSIYASFNDPSTGMPISFAGAGVNSKVQPGIM